MSTKKKIEPFVINLRAHQRPEATAVMGEEYVFWGKKNDYFEFLKGLFYKASKHNAIVNGKTKYIAGGGWGDSGTTIVNSDNETLNDITWKVALDKQMYGGLAMEVIWTKGGKKAEYRHVDFSRVRANKDSTKYFYTKEWITKYGNPAFKPQNNEDWTEYLPFGDKDRGKPQLLYFKSYCPGLDVYPMPEYEASILYIELEYQVANYWYNRVKNGFMPSAILNFYMGQPSDDEMKKIKEKIKDQLAGTENAGQFILNFAANKDSAADVQQITPPELGAEYEALNKTLQAEIMTGHGVTSPELFGIMQASNLGRSQLMEQNELFQNRFVSPEQLKLEMFFEAHVFPYIGVKKAKLIKQEPIGYMFSETVMVKYLPERAISEIVAAKMGVDLKKYPEFEKEKAEKREAEVSQNQRFSKEKKLLEKLKAKAKKRKVKEVISERYVTHEMSKNLRASEEELRMNFAKKTVPIIIGSPIIPINIKDIPTEKISVVYTYEWITGFSDLDKDTSREFCVGMRELSNDGYTWERADIDTLDNETNDPEVSDVWESRGGWYNDNGIAVPHCRHQWKQKVIREMI